MSRRGRPVIVGLLIASAAGACIELGGPTAGVVSISSLSVPSPSVVVGDVMRDSLGVATPLQMTAFDSAGKPLPGERITFFVLDSTVKVDSSGFVHGITRDTLGARVVGGAGSLQTLPQRIVVSVKPVSATKDAAATAITFDSTAADTTKQSTWSPPLKLTLAGASALGAQGFVVTYALTRTPAPFAAGVPTAYLGDDAGKASSRDTTDKLGVAARRVILRYGALGNAQLINGTITDTITVRATVKYLGVDVPGSPIDFIVPVKKKP